MYIAQFDCKYLNEKVLGAFFNFWCSFRGRTATYIGDLVPWDWSECLLVADCFCEEPYCRCDRDPSLNQFLYFSFHIFEGAQVC